jgi:hypothetical protein
MEVAEAEGTKRWKGLILVGVAALTAFEKKGKRERRRGQDL